MNKQGAIISRVLYVQKTKNYRSWTEFFFEKCKHCNFFSRLVGKGHMILTVSSFQCKIVLDCDFYYFHVDVIKVDKYVRSWLAREFDMYAYATLTIHILYLITNFKICTHFCEAKEWFASSRKQHRFVQWQIYSWPNTFQIYIYH